MLIDLTATHNLIIRDTKTYLLENESNNEQETHGQHR